MPTDETYEQWRALVRSRGYVSQLSPVIPFITFDPPEHTRIELRWQERTVVIDVTPAQLHIVGPCLDVAHSALNAVTITPRPVSDS